MLPSQLFPARTEFQKATLQEAARSAENFRRISTLQEGERDHTNGISKAARHRHVFSLSILTSEMLSKANPDFVALYFYNFPCGAILSKN